MPAPKALKFLQPFGKEITDRVLKLREFVLELYPDCNELIYDGYNALAIGWSPTEKQGQTFCSIAVGRSSHNVHFGFYWGNEISDPKKILIGNGKQYRYILVTALEEFPRTYMKKLVKESFANSMKKVKNPTDLVSGKVLVKAINVKKRQLAKSKKK